MTNAYNKLTQVVGLNHNASVEEVEKLLQEDEKRFLAGETQLYDYQEVSKLIAQIMVDKIREGGGIQPDIWDSEGYRYHSDDENPMGNYYCMATMEGVPHKCFAPSFDEAVADADDLCRVKGYDFVVLKSDKRAIIGIPAIFRAVAQKKRDQVVKLVSMGIPLVVVEEYGSSLLTIAWSNAEKGCNISKEILALLKDAGAKDLPNTSW